MEDSGHCSPAQPQSHPLYHPIVRRRHCSNCLPKTQAVHHKGRRDCSVWRNSQVQISRDQATHVASLKMGKLRSDLLASWSFPNRKRHPGADGRWHRLDAHGTFGHLRPPKFWEIANCHLGTFPTNTNKKPCIGGNGVKDNSEAKACSI